jgi:rhamnosyltransferase
MMRGIVGCVILYNPDVGVISNILSFNAYVEEVIVIDNSDDLNQDVFSQINALHNVIYIVNKENVGIANALNSAAIIANNKKYKWMLTMDQDSSFDATTAGDYFKFFDEIDKRQLGILSPSQVDKKSKEDKNSPLIVMTSGNIISLDCYAAVGGFNSDLFIDEVDHDYCLKAILAGYTIKQVNIKLLHALGKSKEYKFLGKKLIVAVHSPIRIYYMTRNNLYMFKTYDSKFPDLMRKRKIMLAKVIFNNIIFDLLTAPKKMFFIYKGILDFRKGKYGKYS